MTSGTSITRLTLAAVVLCTVLSCGKAVGTAPVPAGLMANPHALVANLGQEGGRTVAVSIVAPNARGFGVLDAVHRWEAADIYQYEATLKVLQGASYVDVTTPPLTLVLPQKVGPAKDTAIFANLKQGQLYQVQVSAKGNIGGTAADELLNTVPGTADFDFTATQDVEDTASGTVLITLDATPFSGTGTVTVNPPIDGVYENPTSTESGTVP